MLIISHLYSNLYQYAVQAVMFLEAQSKNYPVDERDMAEAL